MNRQARRWQLSVLLAESDKEDRRLCTRIIERAGHRVTVATDGIEAIRLVRDRDWHVVLAERTLPGASGLDVLERAYELRPDALRLLMGSTLDAQTQSEAMTRAHAHAFIEKPAVREAFAVVVGRIPGEFEVRFAEGGA